MRKIKTLIAISCLLAASQAASAAGGDEVVAKLGSIELKQSQFKALLDGLDADTRKKLMADPAAVGQIIRTEIIRQAVLKEASGKQWDKRPEVQTQIDRARDQIIVSAYLNDIARPPASYPSEEDIQQAYEANKSAFATPAQYHIAQIYLSSSDAKDAAGLQKKAEDLAVKARTGNFEELAGRNSEHKESASKGGDMGWLPETQLIPELRELLPKMTANQVSKPVKSANGWHIIKLLGVKPAGVSPLSDVHDLIASNLRLRKAQQAEQKYLENMLKSEQLSVNEIAVGALLK